MAGGDSARLATARREVALVRTLLAELEQLTGDAATHVTSQLAEELAVLARRLLDVSAAMIGAQKP